jgi:hypothetical protein
MVDIAIVSMLNPDYADTYYVTDIKDDLTRLDPVYSLCWRSSSFELPFDSEWSRLILILHPERVRDQYSSGVDGCIVRNVVLNLINSFEIDNNTINKYSRFVSSDVMDDLTEELGINF